MGAVQGLLGPNGAGKTTLVGLRNLGVYVDPQHARLAAGLRQSPAHRPSRQHRALTEGGPVDTKPFLDRPVEHRHPGRLRPLAVRRYRKG